jgi:hypothetical protein
MTDPILVIERTPDNDDFPLDDELTPVLVYYTF